MALFVKALTRFHVSDMGGTNQTSWFCYSSNDLLSAIVTAGYFNDVRTSIKPGDVIFVLAGKDGTQSHATVRVATVPDSGNVTVALDSVSVRQGAIADLAGGADLATTVTKVNAILAMLRTSNILASS